MGRCPSGLTMVLISMFLLLVGLIIWVAIRDARPVKPSDYELPVLFNSTSKLWLESREAICHMDRGEADKIMQERVDCELKVFPKHFTKSVS